MKAILVMSLGLLISGASSASAQIEGIRLPISRTPNPCKPSESLRTEIAFKAGQEAWSRLMPSLQKAGVPLVPPPRLNSVRNDSHIGHSTGEML